MNYIESGVPFTYQVDDDNLIGNYSGIKKYLKSIINDTPDTALIDDAKELSNYLESVKDDYDLFSIYTDAMGGDSLQGVTLWAIKLLIYRLNF